MTPKRKREFIGWLCLLTCIALCLLFPLWAMLFAFWANDNQEIALQHLYAIVPGLIAYVSGSVLLLLWLANIAWKNL